MAHYSQHSDPPLSQSQAPAGNPLIHSPEIRQKPPYREGLGLWRNSGELGRLLSRRGARISLVVESLLTERLLLLPRALGSRYLYWSLAAWRICLLEVPPLF